jgi:hypothetical protein
VIVIHIPGTDDMGHPTAPSEVIRSHWAVLVDATMGGVPGPHLLTCQDETAARRRLGWWQTERPTANPTLVRRRIVETFGEWEPA